MDMGFPEDVAHRLSNDRKIDDIRIMDTLTFAQVGWDQPHTVSIWGSCDTIQESYWIRIQFDRFMHEHFKKRPITYADRNDPYLGIVARANPRSSLVWLRQPLENLVINRRWMPVDDAEHDFTKIMTRLRDSVSDRIYLETLPRNEDWFPEYYEGWVERNTP